METFINTMIVWHDSPIRARAYQPVSDLMYTSRERDDPIGMWSAQSFLQPLLIFLTGATTTKKGVPNFLTILSGH